MRMASTALCLGLLLPLAGAPGLAAPPPFQVPRTGLVLKFGGYVPSGNSDLWGFNESLLTTEPEDFADFMLGIEFQVMASNYIDFSFEIDFFEGHDVSEYRDFIDPSGFPITQRSTFSLVPLTFSVRWMPAGRYRRGASGFRNQPRSVVPYLSVGGSAQFWEFEMVGDFVDLATLEIFFDRFFSDGVTVGATAAAGLEFPISRAWWLQVEGRYHWAEDDLGADFVGFDELDLGGATFFVGAGLRF